jgi:hypothetical protein
MNTIMDTLKISFDVEDFLWDNTDSIFIVAGETGDLLVH